MTHIDNLRALVEQNPHIDKVYLNAAGDWCFSPTADYCLELGREEIMGEERMVVVDEQILADNPELVEAGVQLGDEIGVTLEAAVTGEEEEAPQPEIITELPQADYDEAFKPKRGKKKPNKQ